MAQRTRWRELRNGVLALIAVVTAAVLILKYARVGSLHGDTFTLYMVTDEARGMIRGTEVWLSGQRVGLVKDVGFLSRASGPADLVVRLDVLTSAREHIRKDSRAQFRSGGSLISSPVLYVHAGTARAPVVADGDTLVSASQPDLELATSQIAIASKELPMIIGNVKTLATQLKGAQRTF